MHNVLRVAGVVTFALALTGTAYAAFAAARVRSFRKRVDWPLQTPFAPPVTIFKPLHGEEPSLYENLRSFCDQEYPDYQVVFGALDPRDPALEVARRLQAEFPRRDISVIAASSPSSCNPKVANLLAMQPHARHGIYVIADSDMCAGREYLRSVVARFEDPNIGAVTCLYGGTSDATLVSQLGAMLVNGQFAPSVLVARAVEPLTYCFGATMAVRREILENAGGFAALADALGDDYALGQLVTNSGKRVALSPYVVHTTIADDSMGSLWLHELRWARTNFAQRPFGYAGLILTWGLPFAIAFAALSRSGTGVAVLAMALAARLILDAQGRKTFAPHARWTPWLVPLRDGLSLAVWFAAFLGRRVRWRSADYKVEAGGHMTAWTDEMQKPDVV